MTEHMKWCIGPQKYVAKCDDALVVDVYEHGDLRLVIERNGTLHFTNQTHLECFFRRESTLEDSNVQRPGHVQPWF